MRFAALLVALTVSSAFAQNTDPVTSRTYLVTGPTPSARDYQELLTVIRTVADVRDVAMDAAAGQITFGGRGESPEMAEWLLQQLDKTPGKTQSETPEFHSTKKDDNLAVFYLAHVKGPRGIQEALTVLRTVADVQKVFAYSALNALAVRAPAGQMALAKWMIQAMDKDAGVREANGSQFLIEGVRDPIVRVYYLANAATIDDMNRMLTAVRTTGGIMKTFTLTANRTIFIRGASEQMAKAESILLTMDQQLAR
jgi:hypothetical protein